MSNNTVLKTEICPDQNGLIISQNNSWKASKSKGNTSTSYMNEIWLDILMAQGDSFKKKYDVMQIDVSAYLVSLQKNKS